MISRKLWNKCVTFIVNYKFFMQLRSLYGICNQSEKLDVER